MKVRVGIPTIGDVVIRRGYGSDGKPLMVLSSVPGPDQFGYPTIAEADRMARAYAEHARVNVWLAGCANEFTALYSFRESTHVDLFANDARRVIPMRLTRGAIA